MKKIIGWSIISIALIIMIVLGAFLALEGVQVNQAAGKIGSMIDKEGGQPEKIGGVEHSTGLSADSTQEEVITVMHKMTHQKVKANDKWGVVPMTPSTVNEVYTVIDNSDFQLRSGLLKIASKWKNGQYDSIVEDHNFFWKMQEGTIGKAYEKMSQVEERDFVLTNFNQEVAQELGFL